MPEEIKPTDNTVEVKSTVDVLDANGGTIDRASSPLAGIFDKIEAGKNEGLSAEDSIKNAPQEVKQAPAQKQKEEVQPPKQEREASDLDKKLGEVLNKKNEDAEVSRQKLLEEAEGRKEAAKEEKPKDKAEIADKQDDVPEDELQVLPHDKPKTAKRIQALLKKIDSINSESAKTKAEVAEKATKLAEYEKKLAEVKTVDPKTEEAIQKQLDELSMYRRRYGLENDPEVKSKFDDRIAASEQEVPAILQKNGASEAIIALIKEEGGWQKFTRSSRTFTLNNGNTVSGAEFADLIINNLPFSDRTKLQAVSMEQVQLQRDKERYFREEQARASEYFKKVEEESKKSSEVQQKQQAEIATKIKSWVDEQTTKNDWLKEREIPKDAAPEIKASIEDDNRYTRQLNALLKKNLSASTVEESLDIVLDATRFYQERRNSTRLAAENAKLKAELEAANSTVAKIKTSSRSTPKAGSINGGGASSIQTQTKQAPRSLEDAFNAIERGEGASIEE